MEINALNFSIKSQHFVLTNTNIILRCKCRHFQRICQTFFGSNFSANIHHLFYIIQDYHRKNLEDSNFSSYLCSRRMCLTLVKIAKFQQMGRYETQTAAHMWAANLCVFTSVWRYFTRAWMAAHFCMYNAPTG